MVTQCPKCSYERTASDKAPDYECPKCGIIYAKYRHRAPVISALATATNVPPETQAVESVRVDLIPANVAVCKNCEAIGQTASKMPGHTLIEVALYLFWIFPGVIYSIWRRKSVKHVCSVCGSDQLLPARSPVAQQILNRTRPDYVLGADSGKVANNPLVFGRLSAGLVGSLAALFLLGGLALLGASVFNKGATGLAATGAVWLVLGVILAAWARSLWNRKPEPQPTQRVVGIPN